MNKGLSLEEKAQYAKQLKENPLFNAWREIAEQGLLREWRNTEHDQVGLREAIWNKIQVIQQIDLLLQGYVNANLLKQEDKCEVV